MSNSPSTRARWTGRIIGGLCIAFLALDGVMKVARAQPVLEACAQLDIPQGAIVGIGAALLLCTALYAVPATAMLGAILLTGYLGGAVYTHVRIAAGDAGGPVFPVFFAAGFGVLLWLSLYLREPRLRALVPFRTATGGRNVSNEGVPDRALHADVPA